jgi:hypothetical protein
VFSIFLAADATPFPQLSELSPGDDGGALDVA